MSSLKEMHRIIERSLAAEPPGIENCLDQFSRMYCNYGSVDDIKRHEQIFKDGHLIASLKKLYSIAVPSFFYKTKKGGATEEFLHSIYMLAFSANNSTTLCQEIITLELHKDILMYLDKYFVYSKTMLDMECTQWMICTLKNILSYHDVRNQYKSLNAIKIVEKYRQNDTSHTLFFDVETFLSAVADDTDVEILYKADTVPLKLLSLLKNCIESPSRNVEISGGVNFIVDFAIPLNQLLLNKRLRKVLVENGMINIYLGAIKVSLLPKLILCRVKTVF